MEERAKSNKCYRARLDCQDWIDLNKGTLLSPNYPFEYGNNVDCAWLLNAPAKHNVWLRVVDMDVRQANH